MTLLLLVMQMESNRITNKFASVVMMLTEWPMFQRRTNATEIHKYYDNDTK